MCLAVDPACRFKDEVDAPRRVHRARATEGRFVLRGYRAPWASPWPKSDIGVCELSFRVAFENGRGEEAASELTRERRRAA